MQKQDNTLLWKSDLLNGTYQNPILYADFSDPDVIRVNDTYYMTASSFNYMPALPILVSKDLVNWELKNYAIKQRLPYPVYDTPAHAKGVWAPSIRYHNNEFYIYFGMPDEGIFMIKTCNPLGEWTKPVLVLEGKGYIDPCPIFDDDGRAYVVHAYAKSRIGFKSILGVFEISPDGERAISDDTFIYDGSKTQITIEGPKVYKRAGLYYILAPAGGVKQGWQTALRSKSIYGPFEEQIVMAQGSTTVNGPHQGGLTDTQSGEEWFIHFQDAGVYGRITHLQPVNWVDGWPVIGDNSNNALCGEPVYTCRKPFVAQYAADIPTIPTYLEASDDFSSDTLSLQWQWTANYDSSFYQLFSKEGRLRLFSKYTCAALPSTLWNQANILTQKLICPEFDATVHLDFSKLLEHESCGLIVMGAEYASLYVCREGKEYKLCMLTSTSVENDEKSESRICLLNLGSSLTELDLSLHFDKNKVVQFSYSLDSKTFTSCDNSFTPTDHTWVGAKIGIYSVSDICKTDTGYTDFSNFTISNNN